MEKNILQLLIGSVGVFFGYFFGSFDGLLKAVIIFVAADYLTGVMSGIAEKKLSSKVGFKGIFKKIGIFMLIGVANILDVHILNSNGLLRAAIIFFFIGNEGISLLENLTELGLPVPKKIVDVLEQLKAKSDDAEKKNSADRK